MRVLLGVTGCIGAYKAPDIVRRLRERDVDVRVILTRAGSWFITPGTLQTVSGHEVHTDLFAVRESRGIDHIELGRHADLLLVAPATANVIAKFAAGAADDLLSTTFLARAGPTLMAPGMNSRMYAHPAVQHNIQTLTRRGVAFVGPGTGDLACGDHGPGRLAEPEQVADAVIACLDRPGGSLPLAGCQVLVTAGPTREPIDPVRFISNPSTGRMGYAVAAAARARGADVMLISGPTSYPPPPGVDVIDVVTVAEMRQAVLERAASSDLVVMAAAVGDYGLSSPARAKIKKTDAELVLRLTRMPDILAEVGAARGGASRPVLVGFAAETGDEVARARAKMDHKNLDYIVANRVDTAESGFAAEVNRVTLLTRDGQTEAWPVLPKSEVAGRLLSRIEQDGLMRPGETVSPPAGDVV